MGGDRGEGVAELCKYGGNDGEFLRGIFFCDCAGKRRNKSDKFTGIHKITSALLYDTGQNEVTLRRLRCADLQAGRNFIDGSVFLWKDVEKEKGKSYNDV